MAEKMNNEEFKIIEINEEVLAGNANKLKLQLVSRLAIMEVLETFLKSKEEQVTKNNAAQMEQLKKEKTDDNSAIRLRLEKLELDNVYVQDAMESIKNEKVRYMDIARKALRMPGDNFEVVSEIAEVLSEINDFEKNYTTSFKDANETMNAASSEPLSQIDHIAIRESVEEAMSELAKNRESSKLDSMEALTAAATKTAEKAQSIYDNKITSSDMDDIFDTVTKKIHPETIHHEISIDDKSEETASIFDVPNKDTVTSENKNAKENDTEKNINIKEENVNNDNTVDFSNDNSLADYIGKIAEARRTNKSLNETLTSINEETSKKEAEAKRKEKEAADKEAELREEQKRLLETAKERLQEYQEEAIRTRDAIESAKSSIEKYDRSIASSNERIKKATDQIYEWRQQLGDANFNAESSKIGHTTK